MAYIQYVPRTHGSREQILYFEHGIAALKGALREHSGAVIAGDLSLGCLFLVLRSILS